MDHYRRALIPLAGLLLCLPLPAASNPTPEEVWRAVLAKVVANASHAKEYTCVQTVERRFYRLTHPVRRKYCPVMVGEVREPASQPGLQRYLTDRLRLDVTLAHHGEIYSWAGASRFEDEGIEGVVRQGPIGSGSFAAFLNMAFLEDVAEFEYQGHKLVDGLDVMEFSFRVPEQKSHYYETTRVLRTPTGYFGSVFLDPVRLEVVRLMLETFPPDVHGPNCQTNSTLDFEAVKIGEEPLLLPVHARQMFYLADGGEVENRTAFTQCREYRGDSTIRFGDAPDTATVTPGPARAAKVQAGLTFHLELLDAIDPATAAAGDQFRARLIGTLRDDTGQTLAAGSIVEGHLKRVALYAWPAVVDLVLSPAWVEAGTHRVALAASRDWRESRRGSLILVPQAAERPAGVFRVAGPSPILPVGFRSAWRTVAVKLQ